MSKPALLDADPIFTIRAKRGNAPSDIRLAIPRARIPLRHAYAADHECHELDQLLRRTSAEPFHCSTLSAIKRVDFMAAWLSWA